MSNIVEKLGPEKVSVGWPWRLTIFSLLTFVTVAVLYAGLEYGYKAYLNNQISVVDASVNKLSQSVSRQDQERFVSFYSQLANLKNLLDKHVLVSKIFPFLEANTNKFVYYNLIDFRIKKRRLNLEGIALSYEIFAQQLEAFNRAPAVERLVVNESQSLEGKVKFRLFLILKPELFKSS